MAAVLNYVAATPAISGQRSRSGEMPLTAIRYVAAAPTQGVVLVRQRSRSGEPMYRPRSRSGEVRLTPLQYVAPSPAMYRERSRSVEAPSQAVCRERSRSVEVPVEVISPQRTLPQVALLSYQPPEAYQPPEVYADAGFVEKTKQSGSSQRLEDAGPKVQMKSDAQEKVSISTRPSLDAKKHFLDASSRAPPVIGEQIGAVISDSKDISAQAGATWSAEEICAGTIKLRWEAGQFSVIDKQDKNECPEEAPEPLVRYFDGSLEVNCADLTALRSLLASDLAVSIGSQPGAGLSGAVVIPGPEFFDISQGPAPAVADIKGLSHSVRFPVLLRHPGFDDTASAAVQDKGKTKVVAAKTKEEEAMEKATAAEQKAVQAEAERDAAYKQAIAAEIERDAEKANLQTAKIEVAEAIAKVHAAEQSVAQSQESHVDHLRAVAAEKERDQEKLKAEAAKIKEEEALAKAMAAEQKALKAEAEREAARTRATAAETERDVEKAKMESAKIEVAEAIAMVYAAQRKAIQAEKERDAIKALAIAANRKRDDEISTLTTSATSQAGSSPELFDISQGDTPATLDSPDSRRTFRFPVPSDIHEPFAGISPVKETSKIGDESDSFILAAADEINLDTVQGDATKSARCPELLCAKDVHAAAAEQTGSKLEDFPVHLQAEAAFAHAYLPVDAYVKLVLSEIAATKKPTDSC